MSLNSSVRHPSSPRLQVPLQNPQKGLSKFHAGSCHCNKRLRNGPLQPLDVDGLDLEAVPNWTKPTHAKQ